ncbi:succinylglutamate desuccinylase/aspartoacylase family protein [Thalassobellus suaedae]|uniref:Succinylglutamate desuccinylase/aspartoacylase family protein n=1 Tax=Thalassobellus suaedae TaxID=3074124 RepID=A0ABY9Y6Z0_9FLAO|nr:succinylglutamate desuccinylase/aspartoacylase family protein [Flavobacteriaceae bacterium HL-DH10]
MTDVYSKALNNKIAVGRILDKIEGSHPGPTVVFFGGIHGNETAGVFAIKDTLAGINASYVKGTIFGVSGNLSALKKNQRYTEKDLNRLWTKESIEAIKKKSNLNADEKELIALLEVLNDILKTNQPPFYFIDLHTTSSQTLPFITINDALINRKFSKQFPVPIILGIEEYLHGPLLSYINELGYVSLGFESGQHDDLRSITNTIAFIYLTLVFSGVLNEKGLVGFSNFYKQLQTQTIHIVDVFEIIYLHKIQQHDTFIMLNGFKSFQSIKKGTKLAINNDIEITSPCSGRIFMPLYQKKGAEGFFIIKPIKPFLLKLSIILRHIKTDSFLAFLPGIHWLNKKEGILQVNLKIAKFFAKSFFHLLGYRNRQITNTHLRLNNRERVAKTRMYKKEPWY